MKAGRKSTYERLITNNLNMIKSMLERGATEKQVYNFLGISHETFYKWKREHIELSDICKNSRQKLVTELRGALVTKAIGFKYKEIKRYKRRGENGEITECIEETEKQALPDTAAINLCLKNYDMDNWSNDPQMLKLKRDELEIKKEQSKLNDW